MSEQVKQETINAELWKCCDIFRGNISANVYKDYILVMLFVKYLSDVYEEKEEELIKKYDGDMAKVNQLMSRERFSIPKGSHFKDLYDQKSKTNIGEIIQNALTEIEKANVEKLDGVFRNINFEDSRVLGVATQRQRIHEDLLKQFNNDALVLRKSKVGNLDVIGNAYEFLISKFAAGAGSSAGEFYTPPEVSDLKARLLKPQKGDRICDPTCGSGSLLIKCANEIRKSFKSNEFALYGQENIGDTYSLCRMNMYLHEIDTAVIKWGDTIRQPKHIENDKLMTFDVVTANPPFSLNKWGAEDVANDKYHRFDRGIPPKSKGDYAFISHMIATLSEKGRLSVVVPHGVLFRASSEGKIRKQLIDDNLLDAVIGLPANLFFGTGIPAAILFFRKNKTDDSVLFIDASREYEDNKNQNRLRNEDIDKIVDTFEARETVDKYAFKATKQDIIDNDYNLNIPRYVDTFEEEEEVDIKAVQEEINYLEDQLASVQIEMKKYLGELGYGN